MCYDVCCQLASQSVSVSSCSQDASRMDRTCRCDFNLCSSRRACVQQHAAASVGTTAHGLTLCHCSAVFCPGSCLHHHFPLRISLSVLAVTRGTRFPSSEVSAVVYCWFLLHDTMVYAVVVCLSVCLSQVSVLLKWLNV